MWRCPVSLSQYILSLHVPSLTCTDSDFPLRCWQETPIRLFVASTANLTAQTQKTLDQSVSV